MVSDEEDRAARSEIFDSAQDALARAHSRAEPGSIIYLHHAHLGDEEPHVDSPDCWCCPERIEVRAN